MMLAYIFIFYLSSTYSVINANPLYQTCASPCQYQQNPWYLPDLIFEPTNVNPYAVLPQTPPPTYYETPDQEYVNKILSDPTIRTILDPNTKLYDINGIEIPKIVPENSPNVINNYIIIPQNVLAEKKNFKLNDGMKWNSNRKKIKSRYKSNSKNENFLKNSNLTNKSYRKINDIDLRDKLIRSKDNNKTSNERKPKIKERNKDHIELNNALDKSNVIPKEKEKVIRLKIITQPIDPKEEAVVHKFRRKFPGIPEELVRSLLAYLKRKILNGDIGVNDQISSNNTNHKQLSRKNSSNSRRRKGRKRNEPENNQEQKKNKIYESTLEKPIHTLDYTKENIVVNNNTSNITTHTENVDVKNTETKPLESECAQKIPIENEAIIETTTVKSILDKDLKLINSNLASQNINEDSQNIIKYKEEITEKSVQILVGEHEKEIEQQVNEKENKPDTDGQKLDYNYNLDNTRLPELGTEDEVPITVNSLYEDYYPDFRTENQFAVSNEEFQSHNAEKYHYTTDRAIETTTLNRERRKYEQNYNRNHYTKLVINGEKVYETDKHNEKLLDLPNGFVPVSRIVQKGSEEISFIAPPALETPDFETKNIRELGSYYDEPSKHEPIYKYSGVSDKTSVYSDTKSSKYDKAGHVLKKNGDLETVFAQSKVVKYGHKPDDAVIIAKSYPDYEW